MTCRMCAASALPMQRHHLIPRREGGRGGANLVWLCRPCHGSVDVKKPSARMRRLRARSVLRERLMPDEIAAVIRERGRAWLDENYPS